MKYFSFKRIAKNSYLTWKEYFRFCHKKLWLVAALHCTVCSICPYALIRTLTWASHGRENAHIAERRVLIYERNESFRPLSSLKHWLSRLGESHFKRWENKFERVLDACAYRNKGLCLRVMVRLFIEFIGIVTGDFTWRERWCHKLMHEQ